MSFFKYQFKKTVKLQNNMITHGKAGHGAMAEIWYYCVVSMVLLTHPHIHWIKTGNSCDVCCHESFSILTVFLLCFYGAWCCACVTAWCHLNIELARQPCPILRGISGNQQWGLTWDDMKLVSIVSWLWFALLHPLWTMANEDRVELCVSVGGGGGVIVAHFTENIKSEPDFLFFPSHWSQFDAEGSDYPHFSICLSSPSMSSPPTTAPTHCDHSWYNDITLLKGFNQVKLTKYCPQQFRQLTGMGNYTCFGNCTHFHLISFRGWVTVTTTLWSAEIYVSLSIQVLNQWRQIPVKQKWQWQNDQNLCSTVWHLFIQQLKTVEF